MSRLCIYFRRRPEQDRWLPGDRYLRPVIRRILRGPPIPSGVDKVFYNLCKGLDLIKMPYHANLAFQDLRAADRVAVLGVGRYCLRGYDRRNRIVAGIALMTHPSEWPTLLEDYPVVKYLQHSKWSNDLYKRFFGDCCSIWPVGIDTHLWRPLSAADKNTDFLIYDKVHWDYEFVRANLIEPIRSELRSDNYSFEELQYGNYTPEQYRSALGRCRAMVFLCEHESQGLAYQECLSSGVPILAWDQGRYLDPNRFAWGTPDVPATSVPYWDSRCGVKFSTAGEFPARLEEFMERLNRGEFDPRRYILENLTLEKSAQHFVEIVASVQETKGA